MTESLSMFEYLYVSIKIGETMRVMRERNLFMKKEKCAHVFFPLKRLFSQKTVKENFPKNECSEKERRYECISWRANENSELLV